MINTKILDIKQLTARVAQADPSISINSIDVKGDVTGNIVVGHGNVIGDHNVIYKVHTLFGAFINLHHQPPSITRRAPSQAPRAPRRFVGRERELNVLEGHIRNNESVLLHGHSGVGKTTLLQKVANGEAAKSLPDGIIYLEPLHEGDTASLQDVLQRLFDRMFESNPRVKLTDPLDKEGLVPASPLITVLERLFPRVFESKPGTRSDYWLVEANLNTTSPLIILDEMGIEQDALNRLPRLLPKSAVLVTSPKAPFDDVYESIQVPLLSREEAIHLFAEKSGISADEKLHEIMDQICRILQDLPLAIDTLANAIRQKRLQVQNDPRLEDHVLLAYIAQELDKIPPRSQDPVQAAVERSFKFVYSQLSREEREILADIAAAPGKSVDREWLEQEWEGAEKPVQKLEDIGLIYANSPRMRLPEGLRGVLQSMIDSGQLRERNTLDEWREALLSRRLLNVDQRNLDFDFVTGELGNILGILEWAFDQKRWSDVIKLGQAIDPYLTLNGLWDAWGTVLKQVEVAARNVSDPKARAWALHQLGTREIGVGTRGRAIDLLKRALELRVRNGEITAAVYTLHNLRFLLPPGPNGQERGQNGPDDPTDPLRKFSWKEPGPILKIYSDILLAALVGAALIGAVLLQPFMRLSLDAKPGRYRPVGQEIEYSYRVDNAGFRQIPGPILVTTQDRAEIRCPDLADIGNNDNILDRNESIICTSFYRIGEADVENGLVTNNATARAGDSRIETRSSLTIPRDERYVMLEIKAHPMSYRQEGDRITVAFIVSNLGGEALSGPVSVKSDKLKANCHGIEQVSEGMFVLKAGGNFPCTATYFITEADVENGTWTDTASVSIGNFESDQQTITVQGPSPLTLTKSATPTTYQDAGQEIQYTYEVTNRGQVPLEGIVTVSDNKVQVTCFEQDGLLNPDESLTCGGSYNITEEDIKAGSVTNRASAGTGPSVSEPISLTIYRGPPPDPDVVLNLDKSANPAGYQFVDQPIRLTYEVTNQGKDPVSGPVMITDSLLQVSCPAVMTTGNGDSFLDPNEKLTCTGTYRINQADIDRRSVTNMASASAGGISSPARSLTIYLEPTRPVLLKTADPGKYWEVGQTIKYTYLVTNPGPAALDGTVYVQDDKVTVDCSQVILLATQNSVLAPGESLNCTGTYVITEADIQNESVTNTAWAVVGNSISEPSSTTIYYDPPPTNLTLSKSARPNTYERAGDTVQYIYFVKNEGPGPLRGSVAVQDERVQVSCPAMDQSGDQDRVLDPDEQIICTGTYAITDADMENGSVTNTAVAHVGDVESNPASATVYARGLNLTGSTDLVEYTEANQAIGYFYEVTSRNKIPLPGPVTITMTDDRIPAGCQPLSEIGNKDDFLDWKESITCTASYLTTQDDVDALPNNLTPNSVTMTAVAHAGNISSPPFSLTSSGPSPDLTLDLQPTPTPDHYKTVGETITYTYELTNTGNMTLFPPFTVTDDLTANGQAFDCQTDKQRLAPGESTTCATKTYHVSQANFDFGNSKVTSNTFATGTFHGHLITSSTVTTTIACPYPPTDGYSYVVRSGETLDIIASWFGGETSKAILQQNNCMGTREENLVDLTLYLPRQPPLASLSGYIRDRAGVPLWNTPVQLFNIRTGVTLTVYTNGRGRYSFSDLEHGTYTLFQARIDLQPNENREQDFIIIPRAQQ